VIDLCPSSSRTVLRSTPAITSLLANVDAYSESGKGAAVSRCPRLPHTHCLLSRGSPVRVMPGAPMISKVAPEGARAATTGAGRENRLLRT
jgi:hypothetical protein